MKITILSGGSGNDSLVKGLRSLSKDIDIKVITNAYDNGKSTGICRAVTDTLGVSDIRKNHSRMYEAMCDDPDRRLLDFYNKRFNFGYGLSARDSMLDLVEKLNLDSFNIGEYSFSHYIYSFFENKHAGDYEYNNFNLANVIYSQMYKERGYEKTNKIFCNLLKLDDFVLLNSFDNVYLRAFLDDDSLLEDEGDIVELADFDRKIINISLYPELRSGESANPNAIKAVKECDLLVISTGTFWSSIYPTLKYGRFWKYINASKAKKVWVMNNEYDKDSYGVSANDFITQVERLGLSLDDFTILANADARKEMIPTHSNTVVRSMGNKNGKHNGNLYANELLKIYYGVSDISKYDSILLDFDDTIWARLSDSKASRSNIRLLKELSEVKDVKIISGNTYEAIRPKLYSVLGSEIDFPVNIWTAAEGACFQNDSIIDTLSELAIEDDSLDELITILNDLGIDNNKISYYGDPVVNVRIKPLSPLERVLLVRYLNEAKNLKLEARIAGTTTVDIVDKNNTKSKVFEHCGLDNKITLYIGDEVDKGNDSDIAKLCSHAICTSGANETNTLLKLLLKG